MLHQQVRHVLDNSRIILLTLDQAQEIAYFFHYIQFNGPFSGPDHVTYSPLNVRPGTNFYQKFLPEMKRAGKISRTAKFEVCSIEI